MDNALFGVLIGGALTLLGVIITNYFNRSNMLLQLQRQDEREQNRLRLDRLEELHDMVGHYILDCRDFSTNIMTFVRVKPSPDEYKKNLALIVDPLPKIATKLKLHAKELNDLWLQMTDSTMEFIRIGDSCMQDKKNVAVLIKHVKQMQDESERILSGIQEIAKEYTHAKTGMIKT